MPDITRILVATDLTDRSERALERGLQLCHDLRASSLTALHVIAEGLPTELAAQQESAAEAFLSARLAQASHVASLPGLGVCVRPGAAFNTIIGGAIGRGADLIIIGAPARHRYSDIFMGTTAELVIRFSDRPVLMVKQASREPYRRVLAAFDGSESASRGLQMALAMAPNAEFRVVHAWWPPHAALAETDVAREAINKENRHLKVLINDAAKRAIDASAAHPANLSIDMVENNPYLVIKNACSWADLLVMGTHSKGRLATTASIGSLARHLLVESSCDVLASPP
jgi:nucleotide-binding universal stress UspA family protein